MIDLKKELETILNIDLCHDQIILRNMTCIRCDCVCQQNMVYDKKTEAYQPSPAYRDTPNPYCSNCEGSGWIFHEYLSPCKYFYTPAMVAHNQDYYYGGTFSNIMTVYLPINEITDIINVNDLIFQLKSYEDGTLYNPIIRLRKWIITDKYNMHLDKNKLEFYKIYTKPMVV